MLNLSLKQIKLVTSLNYRITSLCKKVFVSLKSVKDQPILKIFFQRWRNSIIKSGRLLEKALKLLGNRKMKKIFSSFKDLAKSLRKKQFFNDHCDFFYNSNLKIKALKIIKMDWLEKKKLKNYIESFLKKWALQNLMKTKTQLIKDRKKILLVSLYYDKILQRKAFLKLSKYINFVKIKLPYLFILNKFFTKMKLITKANTATKINKIKDCLQISLMKNVFHRLKIVKQSKTIRNNNTINILSLYLANWRKRYCFDKEIHCKFEFICQEFLQTKERKKIIFALNQLKQYHKKKINKRHKYLEIDEYFNIVHKENLLKTFFKVLKINFFVSKSLRNINRATLSKVMRELKNRTKNYKMILAEAMIIKKTQNKTKMKNCFLILKRFFEETKKKNQKAKVFLNHRLKKNFLNYIIMISYTHRIESIRKVDEFRKYWYKKQFFFTLKKVYNWKKKLMNYFGKRRKKILGKYFFHLKGFSEAEVEANNQNLIHLLKIFHQWKMLTKLRIIKKQKIY